jgi:hypothetical protein
MGSILQMTKSQASQMGFADPGSNNHGFDNESQEYNV